MECGATLTTRAVREVRKTVTVVCAGVPDADAAYATLDAESLHGLTRNFAEWAGGILGKYGAHVLPGFTPEICAVFGVPAVHEDDALRAVHAVAELHERVTEFSVDAELHWGATAALSSAIVTGEALVVEGDVPQLRDGGAVAEARRLQRVAGRSEVLLDRISYQLVAGAVTAELLVPVTVPGQAAGRECWRLVAVTADELPRRHEVALVDRARELEQLEAAYARVVSAHRARLVTVLGVSGIGKSRLVREFVAGLGGATVVTGRCRDTRQGLTYWPLVEVVQQVAGPGPYDAGSLAQRLARRIAADPAAGRHAATLAGLVESAGAPATRQDLVEAVSGLLAALAGRRPVVLVLDDVQWASAALLDLVELLLERLGGSPVLIVAVARPELLEQRPGWGGRAGAGIVPLGVLDESDSRLLVDRILAAEGASTLRGRVVAVAEGNPMFIEELVHKLIDDGLLAKEEGTWVETAGQRDVPLPASISALLGARLDQMDVEQRHVLSRASVVGREFGVADLGALLPGAEPAQIEARVAALVRRGDLVADDRAALTGPGHYRFRHQLTRDAAYHRLPLRERAELHEGYARWLAAQAAGTVTEEVVGFHLERACGYRVKLGAMDPTTIDIAAEAAELLGVAGRRAFGRRDMVTAVDLLGRAAALTLGASSLRAELLPDLAAALIETGRFERAAEVLTEAIAAAGRTSDVSALDRAVRVRAVLQRFTHPADLAAQPPVVAAPGGAGTDWTLLHQAIPGGEGGADRAGVPYDVTLLLDGTPVAEGTARCLRSLTDSADNPTAQARSLAVLAGFEAMRGAPDKARELVSSALGIFGELGLAARAADLGFVAGLVELLAGNPRGAVEELHRFLDLSEGMGHEYAASRLRALLARAYEDLGEHEEAERLAVLGERTAAGDDVTTLTLARAVRGRVAAGRGQFYAATQLAREAVWTAEGGELRNLHAMALLDLAQVVGVAGRGEESLSVAADALELFEAKGNVVGAGAARRVLSRFP
jgi:tetratricopeptide (TPR) repeat protein